MMQRAIWATAFCGLLVSACGTPDPQDPTLHEHSAPGPSSSTTSFGPTGPTPTTDGGHPGDVGAPVVMPPDASAPDSMAPDASAPPPPPPPTPAPDAGSPTMGDGAVQVTPPGMIDASSPPGLTVTWQEACWYVDPQGNRYQAMNFQLSSPTPVPLEGTLLFTTNCDESQGTDNLNDTGGTTPSGSWEFWFIHHPNETNTSAVWWIGDQTSGCVDYANAPDC